MTDEYGDASELGGALPDAAAALLDLLGGSEPTTPGWGPVTVDGDGGASSAPAAAFGAAATGADEVPSVIEAPVFELPADHARDDLEELWAADADGGAALHVTDGLEEFVAAPGSF